jgi:predicted nucleic acid-binding protein
MSDVEVSAIKGLLQTVQIEIDQEGRDRIWSDVYQVAGTYRLNLYDALYLELALRLGLPLAAFDQPLRAAAQRAGVALA